MLQAEIPVLGMAVRILPCQTFLTIFSEVQELAILEKKIPMHRTKG